MITAPALNNFSSVIGAGAGAGASTPTANEAASADRFLKLLVTQMQNQDPLNPMDNAQITSQMAQINMVSGIDKLNTTVGGLNGQFAQLQALTGASLVGRQVSLQGDRMAFASGAGVGGFDLSGSADQVKIEVLNPAGHVIDTLNLGAQGAGRHSFEWLPATLPPGAVDGAIYRFRVLAQLGATPVPSTPLTRDRVEAVNSNGTSLMLETLNNGPVAYSDIKAFN